MTPQRNDGQRRRIPRRGERGAAIVVILLVSGILTLLAASMSWLVSQDAHMATMLRRRAQAHAIAEAGVSHALSVLAQDFDQRTNPAAFPETELGSGVYHARVDAVGNDYARIRSTGIVEQLTQIVEVDVAGPSRWLPDPVIFSNSYFRPRGNGDIFGSPHSNAYSDMSGDIWIGGDATASETMSVQGSTVVEGTAAGNQPIMPYPILDFDMYYQMALNGGIVYNGNKTFQNDTLQPGNGVVWVNGDVTFKSHNQLDGCLIATGDITQSGQLTQTLVTTPTGEELPALMSREGSITLKGQTNVDGLIYTLHGDIDLRGGTDSEMIGKICAGAAVIGRGNWGICRDRPIAPFGLTRGCMRILGWKR